MFWVIAPEFETMLDCFLLFRPGLNRLAWRQKTVKEEVQLIISRKLKKKVKVKEGPLDKTPIENALPVTSSR